MGLHQFLPGLLLWSHFYAATHTEGAQQALGHNSIDRCLEQMGRYAQIQQPAYGGGGIIGMQSG